MKIAVIFTGGTIGSQENKDGFLSPDAKNSYTILSKYEKYNDKENVNFIPSVPFQILSEQMQGHFLEALIKHIKERLQEDSYDGFIVLHGTDTLAYTSSILGYVFSYISIPLVIVSSDFPLNDSRANGLNNFIYAVKFICNINKNGVFVSYQNKNGLPTIHYGTRLLQQMPCSASVYSVKNAIYGQYTSDNNFCTFDDYIDYTSKNLLHPDTEVHLYQSSSILKLEACVGLKYPDVLPSETKAVLFNCYHSGTLCAEDSLLSLANQTKEKSIPFYLTGCYSEGTSYDSEKIYDKYNMIVLRDCSPIACYCKAWLILCNNLNWKYMLESYGNDIVL